MYYNHNLRVNLKEWRNRVARSRIDQFPNTHQYLIDKVTSNPLLFSYLNISEDKPTIEKLQEYFNSTERFEARRFQNEEQEAVIKYHFINYLLLKDDFHPSALVRKYGGGGRDPESIQLYIQRLIDPIINYLEDKLDEGSSVLYLLEKYKCRCEWFHQDRLRQLYQDNSTTGEEKLDEDLRMFLFDQGIDYPFSTPKSSSGRADIVGLLHTKDPLIVEVKIHDESKSYRKNRIAGGFSQIVKYAGNYNKNVGYLVIFNVDPINFTIEPAEIDKAWPNRVCYDGKNFYIIFINLWNEASASKSGKIKNQTITMEDLTSEIE